MNNYSLANNLYRSRKNIQLYIECMNSIYSLEKKRILITGASSGIGKLIALRCSEAGSFTIITGRNEERLNDVYQKLNSEKKQKYISDLSNEADISDLVSDLPQLDGIVLCAGMTKTTPIKYNTRSCVEEVFKTNTFSNITLLQYLFRHNKIKKGASVIFISSVASIKPYKGNSLYSASKGALNSFAKVMALECGVKRIRVNCIHPGIIRTKPVSNFSEEEMAKQAASIPLGFGVPDDIAYGCIYLLSDAAKWITGTELIIDGGQSIS